MSKTIHVLMAEDRDDDAELILNELRDNGYEVLHHRVWGAAAMKQALAERNWDLVTSDHIMPSFNSREALRILKQSGKDIPFILVSGSIGEHEAVEIMRLGAHDYIIKDNITRLVPAIERELREAQIRKDQKLTEERLRQAYALVDNLLKSAPAGIGYLDRNGRFLRINETLASFNGARAQDLIGCTLQEALPEFALVLHPLFEKALETDNAVLNQESSTQTNAKSDESRYWLTSAYPVHSVVDSTQEFIGVGLVVIDITERKRTQIELERAVRTRDTFLSIASHELKTPLTSLSLQTQIRQLILSEGKFEFFTPEKLAELFSADQKQILRLNHLIEDMLDISRINAGKLNFNFETGDLRVILLEVVERIRPQIEARGSALTCHIPSALWGRWDAFRMEQVLLNLLTNASRYGKGKPIHVNASAEGGEARIEVVDQGIGIAPQDHQRIFGQFERAISSNEVSGLGLGLYISREIILGHGGSIEVDSELGKGAVFRVRLPISSTGERTQNGK